MSKIKDHYLSLCRMKKSLRSGDANFIDLVHFMNRHNICYKPGCTTCGAQDESFCGSYAHRSDS